MSGAASPELASMRGRRLVFVSETAKGDKINPSLWKNFADGETLCGRLLFKNIMIWKNTASAPLIVYLFVCLSFVLTGPLFVQAIVVISTNHMLALPLHESIQRRTIIIHWKEKYSSDPLLIDGGEARAIDESLKKNFKKLAPVSANHITSNLIPFPPHMSGTK